MHTVHTSSIRSGTKPLLETGRPPRLSTALRGHAVRAFHPPDSAFGRRCRVSKHIPFFFFFFCLLIEYSSPRFRFYSVAVRFHSSRRIASIYLVLQDRSTTGHRRYVCNCHVPALAATWPHRSDRCNQCSPQGLLHVVTSANPTDAL